MIPSYRQTIPKAPRAHRQHSPINRLHLQRHPWSSCPHVQFVLNVWTKQLVWLLSSVSTFSTARACRNGEVAAAQFVGIRNTTMHKPRKASRTHRSRPSAELAVPLRTPGYGSLQNPIQDAVANLECSLICGHVGCGRYEEAHARAHFEDTSHSFAMDISTQHIWDYTGDEYVHRLIQNKADGQLVELPSAVSGRPSGGVEDEYPKDKMENMSLEYASMLTSQLDNQRLYFEEQVDRAADKASKAVLDAEAAYLSSKEALATLAAVQASHEDLRIQVIPSLEREKERAERKAEKFESTARRFQTEWREKDVINESLMDRIRHLDTQVKDLTLKNSDLEEQNRDLSFFISSSEKLRDQGEEVQEGTVTVGPGKKKKGRGKK